MALFSSALWRILEGDTVSIAGLDLKELLLDFWQKQQLLNFLFICIDITHVCCIVEWPHNFILLRTELLIDSMFVAIIITTCTCCMVELLLNFNPRKELLLHFTINIVVTIYVMPEFFVYLIPYADCGDVVKWYGKGGSSMSCFDEEGGLCRECFSH